VPQADLAGLVDGGVVVLGQPGQAGDHEAVVVLVDSQGYGPLGQPLDLFGSQLGWVAVGWRGW
jgi:hypothetical protein